MPKVPSSSVFDTAVINQGNGGVEKFFHQTITIIEENLASIVTGPPNDSHWILVKAGPDLANASFLTDAEIQDGQRYRHPGRHRQWLLGRAAAKYLIMKHAQNLGLTIRTPTDFEILRNPNGWPQVQNLKEELLPVSLTISHSGELVFCALCKLKKGCLGADLEKVAPKTQSMLEDFYTQDERHRLNNLPQSQQDFAATLIWCAKEAILKAKKTGLMENTKHIEVDINKFESPYETNWTQVQTKIGAKQNIPVWWRYIEDTNLCLTLARLKPSNT